MKLWLTILGMATLAVPAKMPAGGPAENAEVRYLVIRAPELEVVRLVQQHADHGSELAAHLWQAVRQGRARVMVDLAATVVDLSSMVGDPMGLSDRKSLRIGMGRHLWLPSELDQDTDRLFLVPTNTDECLAGTRFEYFTRVVSNDDGVWVEGSWGLGFAPCDPVPVVWPTSWLRPNRIRKSWFSKETTHVPTGRPVRGWLDWRDRVESTVDLRTALPVGRGPVFMAVLPPADQHWPLVPQKRELDVFLAEAKPVELGAGDAMLVKTGENVASGPSNTLFYGISLPTAGARALLQNREQSPTDDALLQSLLTRVESGSARLFMVAGSQHPKHELSRLTSARLHDFPTEMPSIPSAWDTRPVGTLLEMESYFDLRHHIAPPARTEWKLDLDNDDVIMWEPRFRELKLGTCVPVKAGAFLLAATPIPRVMQGDGLTADETLLLFSERKAPNTSLVDSWANDAGRANSGLPFEWEAEILIFEIPATEATLWDPASFDPDEDDSPRLKKLLERQRTRGVGLIIQATLRGFAIQETTLSLVEEYMTATEFDPPDKGAEKRMRPTALEYLPVGLQVTLNTDPAEEAAQFDYDIRLTTYPPVEPTLLQTLDIAARGKEDEYGAKHHFNQWKWQEHALLLKPGTARCLGSQPVAGGNGDTHQVAFIRLRTLTLFPLPESK